MPSPFVDALTPSSSQSLCLVIPAYRDSERLAQYLPTLCLSLAPLHQVSILVVDDGSGTPDSLATAHVVESLCKIYPALLPPLLLEQNRGKGGAIYAGWETAPKTEWVAFVDADGATPADEVTRLIRMAQEEGNQTDVFLASRVKMLGHQVHRSLKRHITGRIFATLASWKSGLAIYDSQCGCKIIRRRCYEAVRSELKEQRFAFDIELLTKLSSLEAVMREVPVNWSDIPGSKVSLSKDGMQMLMALWKIDRCRMR